LGKGYYINRNKGKGDKGKRIYNRLGRSKGIYNPPFAFLLLLPLSFRLSQKQPLLLSPLS